MDSTLQCEWVEIPGIADTGKFPWKKRSPQTPTPNPALLAFQNGMSLDICSQKVELGKSENQTKHEGK